ncbi:TPA: hypothetical protein ACH3X2_002355 [Trebouxia sp. C0005]
MDEWVSGDTFSDDPMEAPTQPAMQAEPAADAAEVRKVSKLPLPARKVPARPLPGELAVLDSISTLHFRKVAVSARTTSLPKIHPDIVGLGDHLTPESLLAGGFLQGSKPHTTPHLQVSGVQSLLVGQSMLNGSGSEHLSLLTGGSTIPAWSTNRPTAAVLHSFNKYSKLEAKKPDSFGALPTDSAFDAARLEFKLVDQTVLKAASSDLTRPFNDLCNQVLVSLVFLARVNHMNNKCRLFGPELQVPQLQAGGHQVLGCGLLPPAPGLQLPGPQGQLLPRRFPAQMPADQPAVWQVLDLWHPWM